MLHFCRENFFDFSFSILQQLPKNFSVVYCDLRTQTGANYMRLSISLFSKQIGVLLKHRNEEIRYEIGAKMSHNKSYDRHHVTPIYPDEEVPPLLEFLNRQNHPEHDELRFKILKWIIDERKLKDLDLSLISKNYLLDVLTLVWLTSNGFITTTEADLILLTIKQVELDLMPENLEPPLIVDPRAFCVSFLFTKFHTSLGRSLEVVGLENSLWVSFFLFIFVNSQVRSFKF